MKPFFDPRSLNASIQVTLSLFTLDPCWAHRDHLHLVQIVHIAVHTARFSANSLFQLLLSVVVSLTSLHVIVTYLLYASVAMQDHDT